MIDFWEAFGRMATNANYRDSILNFQPSQPYVLDLSTRASIPESDFDAMRLLFKAGGSGVTGPVALFALGEMLTVLRYPGFKPGLRNLFKAIADTGVTVAGQSTLFYTALGALALDTPMRANLGLVPAGVLTIGKRKRQIHATPKHFDDYGFAALTSGTSSEQSALTAIFQDANVAGACQNVCDTPDCMDPTGTCEPWQLGCNVNTEFWPDYQHPIATAPTGII